MAYPIASATWQLSVVAGLSGGVLAVRRGALTSSTSSHPTHIHLSPVPTCPPCQRIHYPSPPLDVSSWADVVTHSTKYGWSSPLHFTNVRDNSTACLADKTKCTFDYDRDCVDRDGNNPGFCNAGAIANYTTRLSQGLAAGLANNDTRDALKFLIHFVGDIHQRPFPSPFPASIASSPYASSPGTDTHTHTPLHTHHSFVVHAHGPTNPYSGQWAAHIPTIMNIPHVFAPTNPYSGSGPPTFPRS